LSASPLEVLSRLDALEQRMANVERKIDESKESLLAMMEGRFNWVMGLVIVSILIPIVERFMR
jgi:hypothetical protein